MRGEPRLLVPVFLAAVVALAWRRRRRPEGERLGLALTVAGAGVMLLLALWEFFRSGTFLQLEYYFDQLYPFFFVMLAAAVFALLGWASREVVASFAALAGIGLVVGAAPLAVVFGIERTELWGRGGAEIAVALMAATLLLALVLRLGLARRTHARRRARGWGARDRQRRLCERGQRLDAPEDGQPGPCWRTPVTCSRSASS